MIDLADLIHVLRDVAEEHAHQDELWGTEHDDGHASDDRLNFIEGRLGWLLNQVGEYSVSDEGFRDAMIKIAALAVAAVEAYDRI